MLMWGLLSRITNDRIALACDTSLPMQSAMRRMAGPSRPARCPPSASKAGQNLHKAALQMVQGVRAGSSIVPWRGRALGWTRAPA